MPEHAQHDICPATNDQHRSTCTVTYAETYAVPRTHLNQLPEPTNLHRHACRDIRNTTDIPQTTTFTGRPAPSRVSGHTLRDRYPTVSSHRQTSLQLAHAGTYATARNRKRRRLRHRHPRQHRHHRLTRQASAIDHFDRDIRRRVTARVWRAAAPRRPRSSSTRAG